MTAQMEAALMWLNHMISEGGEFPDAAYRSATIWGVDQAKLEREYDAQYENGGRP
jgi:hypothetical protein